MREYKCEAAEEGYPVNYDAAWKCMATHEEHAARLFVEHLREEGITTHDLRIRVMRVESTEFTMSTQFIRVNPELERAAKTAEDVLLCAKPKTSEEERQRIRDAYWRDRQG